MKEPNWDRRVAMELWTLHEMSCFLGSEEPAHDYDSATRQLLTAEANPTVRDIYRAIKDASINHTAPPVIKGGSSWWGHYRIVPRDAVKWAEARGFDIPTPLLALLEKREDLCNSCDDTALSVDSTALETGLEQEPHFDPLPISGIALIFTLQSDQQKNLKEWKHRARDAARNGLVTARRQSSRGTGDSLFDPLEVGDWLIKRGLLNQERVYRALAANLPKRSEHLRGLYTGE